MSKIVRFANALLSQSKQTIIRARRRASFYMAATTIYTICLLHFLSGCAPYLDAHIYAIVTVIVLLDAPLPCK